jgi:outer membrane protein
MLKQTASAAVAALAITTCTAVQAQQGPWMLRARALHLGMDNSNSSGQAPLAALPADSISVNDKTIPDFDISYFFTRNIAAELLLTVPQKQDVTINALGLGRVGSFRHLPPTLTLQYHFRPEETLRPYVGAGINYTRITGVNMSAGPGLSLGLENDSWGGALQAGFDYKLTDRVFLNLDVKKIYIKSDVFLNGSRISTLKLDPLAVGAGVGWRF